MKKLFFPLLLLTLLTGCISSERMVRNSPLGHEKKIEIRFDSETVNLWPLFYRDPASMNVLWPLYDQDSAGFSIRPFYVKEGGEHSFLWPLSGWNDNEGWFLTGVWNRQRGEYGFFPLYWQDKSTLWLIPFLKNGGGEWYERIGLIPLGYYSDPDAWFAGPVWRAKPFHGVFPLYWHTQRNRLCGPVWWNTAGEFSVFPLMDWHDGFKRILLGWKGKDSAGVFPLLRLSEEFNYAGPVWWQEDACGFFPLFWRYPDFNLAGPVWWQEDACGFFPFFWRYPDFTLAGPVWWKENAGGFFPMVWLKRDGVNVAGPVWWSPDGGGFFPLANFSPEFNNVGPVWWSGKGGGFFPLAGFEEGSGHVFLYWWGKGGLSGVLPFGYRRKDAHSDYLQLLGPVAGYDSREKYHANHFLYPLWRYRRNGERTGWMLWPLVNWGGSAFENGFLPSPVLQVSERKVPGSEKELLVPNSGFTPFGRSFSNDRELPSRILDRRQGYFLCGLGYQENGEARIWKPGTDSGFLTQLGAALTVFSESKEAPKQIGEWMEKLGIAAPVPGSKEEAEALLRKLVADYCTEVSYSEHRTLGGLGSWYERFEDDHWGQFLFGLVLSRKYENTSDFRILGYLYREKRDGEASEYLIPPFINVKSSPERSSWSFLYRFLHYENNNGKKSGSVFFIPWGKR